MFAIVVLLLTIKFSLKIVNLWEGGMYAFSAIRLKLAFSQMSYCTFKFKSKLGLFTNCLTET